MAADYVYSIVSELLGQDWGNVILVSMVPVLDSPFTKHVAVRLSENSSGCCLDYCARSFSPLLGYSYIHDSVISGWQRQGVIMVKLAHMQVS